MQKPIRFPKVLPGSFDVSNQKISFSILKINDELEPLVQPYLIDPRVYSNLIYCEYD